MLTTFSGVVLLALSIVLIKLTLKYQSAGNRFFSAIADSTWLPIVFTALFGLGVVATAGGLLEMLTT